MREAHNRSIWRAVGDVFVQQWTVVSDDNDDIQMTPGELN